MTTTPSHLTDPSTRYLKGGRATAILNRIVGWLVRRGLDLKGARILEVRGRTSGEPRTTPVNLLHLDGRDYLVAPRGQTQWVRNLRAAGEGALTTGRRRDVFTTTEVSDDAKAPVLRAYIDAWWFEVGNFFEGIDRDPTPEQLVAIAPGFPVFCIRLADREVSAGR